MSELCQSCQMHYNLIKNFAIFPPETHFTYPLLQAAKVIFFGEDFHHRGPPLTYLQSVNDYMQWLS